MTDQTAEQAAAEAAAKKAELDAAKRAKAAENAAAKAAAKEARDREKAEKAAAKEAKKLADAEAKAAAKAAQEAAKEANKMPMQNGIRRPKPDGLCGKAWAIFDSVSSTKGSPASIAESLEIARAQGLNESNVRAEYARWRKFYNVTGRVAPVKAEEPAPAPAA